MKEQMESGELSVLGIKLSLTVLLKSRDLFSICDLNVPVCALLMAVEFLWSHTTESMCVGYMSAQDGKAKVSGETGRSLNTLQPSQEPLTGRVHTMDFLSLSWAVAP